MRPSLWEPEMKPTASAFKYASVAGSGLILALTFLTSNTFADSKPDNLQPLPDADMPAINTPAPMQEITQIREQNAVTSVRVKRGENTYYVTPSEQFSSSQSGGRAAQWQIFEFKSKKNISNNALPPPSLQR